MKKLVVALLAVLPFVVAASVAAEPPRDWFVDEASLPFGEIPGLPSQRVWGVHGGAGYRIEVPENWNGELVVWAHGYRGTTLRLSVDNPPIRAHLLSQGYAWAASSYRANAYDPSQGAKDSHALTTFFNGRFGRPDRVYVAGGSMGGHVAAIVAEQWPQTYDGAMPICGVLGDYELFDFFYDFNVAAQTLSGIGATFPYGPDYLTVTVPATKAALGPSYPFALNAQGQHFKSLVELRSGGDRPVYDQAWLYWNAVAVDFLFGLGAPGENVFTRVPGQLAQNSDVVYQFDTDPALSAAEAAFNAAVQRQTADPQARRENGIANIAPTTGDLRIPMLTLHTLGDLFVPFHMEQEYARRVAAHGASDLLVQRATRDVGHCSFTAAELVRTFDDLVTWVEDGVRPAGDDVLDPAAVASPTFGCTFTDRTAPRIWDVPGLGFLAPPHCP